MFEVSAFTEFSLWKVWKGLCVIQVLRHSRFVVTAISFRLPGDKWMASLLQLTFQCWRFCC